MADQVVEIEVQINGPDGWDHYYVEVVCIDSDPQWARFNVSVFPTFWDMLNTFLVERKYQVMIEGITLEMEGGRMTLTLTVSGEAEQVVLRDPRPSI